MFLISLTSYSRVFDVKSSKVAFVFAGGYAPSAIAQSQFGASSGTGVNVDGKIRSNYLAEIGIAFRQTHTTVRLASHFTFGQYLSNVPGHNASGVEVFRLDTKTNVLQPELTLETRFLNIGSSSFYLTTGINYSYLQFENSYRMSAAGTTEFGVNDFIEKGRAWLIGYKLGLGYEFAFADSTTLALETGYRRAVFNTIKSDTTVRTTSGNYETGDVLKNNDSSNREIDASVFYFNLAFRIYLF